MFSVVPYIAEFIASVSTIAPPATGNAAARSLSLLSDDLHPIMQAHTENAPTDGTLSYVLRVLRSDTAEEDLRSISSIGSAQISGGKSLETSIAENPSPLSLEDMRASLAALVRILGEPNPRARVEELLGIHICYRSKDSGSVLSKQALRDNIATLCLEAAEACQIAQDPAIFENLPDILLPGEEENQDVTGGGVHKPAKREMNKKAKEVATIFGYVTAGVAVVSILGWQFSQARRLKQSRKVDTVQRPENTDAVVGMQLGNVELRAATEALRRELQGTPARDQTVYDGTIRSSK